ncbi:MAG: polysaccharide deacetylase family protein, partial [Clostridia bacterium]
MDHLTTKEYENILQSFYEKDFALVDFFHAYKKENGKFVQKPFMFPKGKKPLILSFDDMTFDNKNLGTINKLVYDKTSNTILDYSKYEKTTKTNKRENVTILESFIKSHPDFSHEHARAILCVNGYNGILGYRIHAKSSKKGDALEKEKTDLLALTNFMKKQKYHFACHGYNHYNTNRAPLEQLRTDTIKWQKEIEPFTGETNIYCYPGGIHRCGSENNKLLKDYGYEIFFCVGQSVKKQNETAEKDATYFYRKPLDGSSLRTNQKGYMKYFDSSKIYDSRRFLPFESRVGY